MAISMQDFLKPIHLNTPPTPKDYEQLQSYIRCLNAVSHIGHHGIYLIDYFKKGFLYVSDLPSFLGGNSTKPILQGGYLFYLKSVPAEDIELLISVNEAVFEFYRTIPPEEKLDYSISYDFRVKQPNGSLILINHKLAPLALDELGDVWIAVCVASLSCKNKPGNVIVKNAVEKKVFEFDLNKKKWNKTDMITINSREREVLIFSIRGFTVEEIARELYLSVDTIKFHKKTLFKKLRVNSISEAIFEAINLGLI